MIPLLELQGISASYGSIEVIHDVSLSVWAGDIVVVLGPNGAGKTTLLNVAAGVMAPTAGQLLLGGRPMRGADPGDLARAGLCTVPEGRAIFPNLTVQENLLMMSHRGLRPSDIEEQAFAHFPRLAERRHQLAGSMSGGEQQMLAMARAVATRPSVLLVDELSMGLAPIIVTALFEVVAKLAAEGVTVVMVEQFAEAALDIASSAAVMISGRVAHRGSPAEIRAVMHDAYLGAES